MVSGEEFSSAFRISNPRVLDPMNSAFFDVICITKGSCNSIFEICFVDLKINVS